MKKWIFFDLDDTLWDFSTNSLTALHSVYSKFYELQALYSEDEFIRAYHLKNSELWRQYAQGTISSDLLRSERFEALLRGKIQYTHKLAKEMDCAYLWILSELPNTIDGAFETLDFLRKKYLIGIISNGFIDTQYRKLKYSGLQRYIQRMIVSDEAGIQKPEKGIFEYALNATGCKREEAILIGDNADTDIRGAINAGWDTIFFDRFKTNKIISRNIIVIDNLKTLIKLF